MWYSLILLTSRARSFSRSTLPPHAIRLGRCQHKTGCPYPRSARAVPGGVGPGHFVASSDMTLCGASASSSFALNSSSASSAHKSGLPPVSDGQRFRTAASCVAPKKPAVVRIGMQVTTCRNRRHESAGGMMRDASQTAHFWGTRLGAMSRVDRVVLGTFFLVAPDLFVLVEFLLLLILDVLIIGLIGDDPTLRLFGQPFAICSSEVRCPSKYYSWSVCSGGIRCDPPARFTMSVLSAHYSVFPDPGPAERSTQRQRVDSRVCSHRQRLGHRPACW